jgi:hypothetical protein
MKKLFDYKFLITLGLSLIVYFLYREVEILNKRIIVLERTTKNETVVSKKLIELPLPPQEEKKTKLNEMVEEYSNEETVRNNIYSHDNLETNTNEQDTLMVDSILNMVKIDSNKTSISEHNTEQSSLLHSSSSSSEKEHVITPINDKLSSSVSVEVDAPNNEIVLSPSEEEAREEEAREEEAREEELLVKLVKTHLSLDALNKKRLDDLQELANNYNIDIHINGKKKKKSDLALEIFNKQ